MLESFIAVFLLGFLAGGFAIHLVYAHLHRTRQNAVRAHEQTGSALALREAFFSAACRCPNPSTFLASCPVHGSRASLRVVRRG